MKKKVLSIALIAMSLVSFSGLAQNPNSKSCNNADGTCIEKVKEKKGKEFKKEKRNPFEGMNLTDAQKSQLEDLNAKRKAAKEAAKAEFKEQKQLMKNEKRAKDSLRMVQKRADKLNYLQEVKGIIGPDQYVVFLENYFVNGGGQKGPKMMKQGKPGMAHHKGDRQKDGKKDGRGRQGDQKMKNNTQASL
ncbi:MAG: hypothetical protein K2N05_06045 [Muribaculaceae bacterium]|nr:hypothetical protein [Muribaculaceae bacterium]